MQNNEADHILPGRQELSTAVGMKYETVRSATEYPSAKRHIYHLS